jgi:hypothetical protein
MPRTDRTFSATKYVGKRLTSDMLRSARNLALMFAAVLFNFSTATAQHTFEVRTPGTRFEVTVPDKELSVTDAQLEAYLKRGAKAIVTYFGAFPMKHVNIHIRAANGDRVRFGRSSPQDGGTIMLLIGRDAKADDLDSDWTLTHEMSHLAFPAVEGDNHDWLQEGMATYVEPIARAQAGFIPPAEVWRQFMVYMPKGLPQIGDQGLDNTRTWGRVYWGGALFCLMADVEIRKQSHNQRGLEDAFRGIMREDGTMEWEWKIDTIFATGDEPTRTHVLQKLYREWKDKPVDVDLAQLWRDLGVELKGDSAVLHDDAPLASIRKAITRPR